MAKLSLFRGDSTAVTGRTVTDGQVLVDLTNHSLFTDVGNSRISLNQSRPAGTQSNWAESDSSSVTYIKHKPTKLSQFDSTYVVYDTHEPLNNLVVDKTRWFGDDGKVDLTFMNMDGSVYMVLRRKPGEPFPVIKTPVLSGYIFDYWTPSFPNTVPNEDTTYVAVAKGEVVLTFLGHGGSTYETVSARPGSTFPTITDPTYTDSRFLGWNPTFPSTVPDEDTTYTSSWLDAVTLTFLGHGGSTYTTKKGFPGDSFPSITNPTYTNSRFLGWNPSLPGKVPSSSQVYYSNWLDAVYLSVYVNLYYSSLYQQVYSTLVSGYYYPGDSFPSYTLPSSVRYNVKGTGTRTYTFSSWADYSGLPGTPPSKVPNSSTSYQADYRVSS